jgi:hypothetical protein
MSSVKKGIDSKEILREVQILEDKIGGNYFGVWKIIVFLKKKAYFL